MGKRGEGGRRALQAVNRLRGEWEGRKRRKQAWARSEGSEVKREPEGIWHGRWGGMSEPLSLGTGLFGCGVHWPIK